MPRGVFYVSDRDLERARAAIAEGKEYESRISSLRFARFTADTLYVYWCNSTATWKRKSIKGWQGIDGNMTAAALNQALSRKEWEFWL